MANLVKYPIRPGDNAAECPGIDDELWERQYLACARIERETGVVHRVLSGKRDSARQEWFWHCYQCCCCNNCNLAARPGTSFHELGLAIDFTNPPRNYPASTRIFAELGIGFPIWGSKPEPWHGQMIPGRAPLPDSPTLPSIGVNVAGLIDSHTIDGVTVQARLFLDAVQIRYSTDDHPVWAANKYGDLWNYGDGEGHAVGKVPNWMDQITVNEVDLDEVRFCVMVLDSNSGIAYAAFQKPGTHGAPTLWDCNGLHSGGWYPA